VSLHTNIPVTDCKNTGMFIIISNQPFVVEP